MSDVTYPIPEDYYEAVLKAIRMTWDRILKEYNNGVYDADPGNGVQYTLRHCGIFMYHLYSVRKCIRSGQYPDERERQMSYPGQIIGDNWDWSDPLAEHLMDVFNDFLRQERFDLKEVPALEPDIEEIRQKFDAWRLVFEAEEDKRKKEELQQRRKDSQSKNWRGMPHLPDPQSMELQRWDSIERRTKNDAEAPLAEARAAKDDAFFKALATACFIEGYTDYLVNEPLSKVISRLRRACDHAAQALQFGFQAHVWNINDYLHEAIAVNHHALADTIIHMRQEEWDTNRIRPVNWLITRIRIVMDLYEGKEAELKVLLENERKGLFEEELPSELTPDVPEMRNFYELLKALVERNEKAFNQALAARMPIREQRYTVGGTIAPIALLDVHGLALCRLARQRALYPKIDHVYMPLEVLDL
jgi:hypothetical protein